jgi:hypothetical protein
MYSYIFPLEWKIRDFHLKARTKVRREKKNYEFLTNTERKIRFRVDVIKFIFVL